MTKAQDRMATLKDRVREKIQHQYKESPNLRGMIDVVLDEVVLAGNAIADIMDFFYLDTAVGEQLTFIGNNVGWPREHCNGKYVAGVGLDDYIFTDDELYRSFIKAKIKRNRSNGSMEDMLAAAGELFGPQVYTLSSVGGVYILGLGRSITAQELELFPLYFRVLPQVRGTTFRIHEGDFDEAFGFGTGWGGFCGGGFGCIHL